MASTVLGARVELRGMGLSMLHQALQKVAHDDAKMEEQKGRKRQFFVRAAAVWIVTIAFAACAQFVEWSGMAERLFALDIIGIGVSGGALLFVRGVECKAVQRPDDLSAATIRAFAIRLHAFNALADEVSEDDTVLVQSGVLWRLRTDIIATAYATEAFRRRVSAQPIVVKLAVIDERLKKVRIP